MTIIELIKSKIFKKNGGVEKLNGTPNDKRLTFITDNDAIRIEKIREAKVWFYGDASELLNYYTNQMVYGWVTNPIYNRNSVNLFWGQSVNETNIKRVHSGIPKAIVDTISDVVGKPTIDYSVDPRLENIVEKNDLLYRLVQDIRPMTSVEGDGCFKINFSKSLANHPLIEFYGAEDWEPIVRSNLLLGIIFKTYYKDKKGKDYVLMETRSLVNGGCLIEYELYKLGKQNDLYQTDFNNIPGLEYLRDQRRMFINGVNYLFAVPLKYYTSPIYKNRGKSIFDGKITLFDMLDEIWSQASQTNRVSTPVEYYDVSLLERDRKGNPILPSKYNRQYIAKEGSVDGDGNTKSEGIVTTQPDLNFDKYSMLASDVLSLVLIGNLSPSTLGLDIAKKDNAEAQREKEKQTIFTRNTYIDRETSALKDLLNQCLMIQDYLDTGTITKQDYDISITYDEFANPSFESELQILGPAWSQGQISTKQYLKMLWAGKLSEEEKLEEEKYLEENKARDNFDMGDLLNNENGTGTNLPGQAEPEASSMEIEE